MDLNPEQLGRNNPILVSLFCRCCNDCGVCTRQLLIPSFACKGSVNSVSALGKWENSGGTGAVSFACSHRGFSAQNSSGLRPIRYGEVPEIEGWFRNLMLIYAPSMLHLCSIYAPALHQLHLVTWHTASSRIGP